MRNLICFIRGPKDTIFEGAYFKVHCHIPDRYPFEPPVMIFMTKVWHPNISSVVNSRSFSFLVDWSYLFRYFEVQVDSSFKCKHSSSFHPSPSHCC